MRNLLVCTEAERIFIEVNQPTTKGQISGDPGRGEEGGLTAAVLAGEHGQRRERYLMPAGEAAHIVENQLVHRPPLADQDIIPWTIASGERRRRRYVVKPVPIVSGNLRKDVLT